MVNEVVEGNEALYQVILAILTLFIDQVKNGVAIRMAVLYELLGGAPIGENK